MLLICIPILLLFVIVGWLHLRLSKAMQAGDSAIVEIKDYLLDFTYKLERINKESFKRNEAIENFLNIEFKPEQNQSVKAHYIKKGKAK